MAPEIHNSTLKNANLEDLKITDIWSLGMLAYAAINPNLINPYHKEAEDLGRPLTMDTMKLFTQIQQLPTHDLKYESIRVTEWWQLEEIFQMCAKFEPSFRPSTSEILQVFNFQNLEDSLTIKSLNVSQSTALEKKDNEFATIMQLSENAEIQAEFDTNADLNIVENDGTNACVFFALHVCDIFMQNVKNELCLSWEDLVGIGEETISTLPLKINAFRDMTETYDPIDAKAILTSNNLLAANYELSEECVSDNGVFTGLGRKELFDALSKQDPTEQGNRVGLYTCSPYTFLVGTNNSSYFLMDTHPIGEDLGGNGNGILVVTSDLSEKSCKLLIQWLLKRLKSSGVSGDSAQSFAWITEVHGIQGM